MAEVHFEAPQGTVPAHLSVPSGAGPWPAVVVLMDIHGMSDDLRRQCERLAANGYLALAPDLFSFGSKLHCIRSIFASLRSGEGRTFQEIEAARAFAAAREDCSGRVGVIGFCMGGGFALMAAPRSLFQVASVNYGQVPSEGLERLLSGSCPLVASYGGRDRTLRGAAPRLASALETNRIRHDVKEYPAAGHGFMNQHHGPLAAAMSLVGIRYRPQEAEDSWQRILSFFAAELRPSPPFLRPPGGA